MARDNNYKAILFDLGGVVFDSPLIAIRKVDNNNK